MNETKKYLKRAKQKIDKLRKELEEINSDINQDGQIKFILNVLSNCYSMQKFNLHIEENGIKMDFHRYMGCGEYEKK